MNQRPDFYLFNNVQDHPPPPFFWLIINIPIMYYIDDECDFIFFFIALYKTRIIYFSEKYYLYLAKYNINSREYKTWRVSFS